MIVCAALALALAVAVEDERSCRIRNSFCLAMAALGLAFQAVRIWAPELSGVLAFHLADETSAPQAVLAAALLVLLCGVALELAWRRIHGASGMGLGDIKYIAAWAMLLGPGIFVPLAAAALVGALVTLVQKKKRFAFGPYLSAAFSCMLVLLSSGIL